MNVLEILGHAEARAGGRPALIEDSGQRRRTVSYPSLAREIGSAASTLMAAGLRPGDKVLLAVPLSIETYVAMLAILKAGLVVTFIDPAHPTRVMARCLRAHPPAAIIATRPILLLSLLSPELRRIRMRFSVGGNLYGAIPLLDADSRIASPKTVARSPEDSALLTFTSGSTGDPKPVIRTHGFLINQLEILQRIASYRPRDVELVAMPMFVLMNLAHGITSVIPDCEMKRPGRADPKLILAQLLREHVTRVVASPALLERVARYCQQRNLSLPHLRYVATGGGPVPPALPDTLRVIAPHAVVRIVYGSTEAEPISSVDADDISITDARRTREGAGLLVGRPVRGCGVRILAGAESQVGEIIVSGKHVLPGYADPARDGESKMDIDGVRWHRTGDAGYLDEHGRLWLVGRCEAAISDARGTVYPFQVEYAVGAVRGIRRAAMIERDGERVLVVETARRQFSADCIKAARCIAEHHVDRIITVRRIPMDRRHDAKVDYPALAKVLDGRLTRLRIAVLRLIKRSYGSRPSSWSIHST